MCLSAHYLRKQSSIEKEEEEEEEEAEGEGKGEEEEEGGGERDGEGKGEGTREGTREGEREGEGAEGDGSTSRQLMVDEEQETLRQHTFLQGVGGRVSSEVESTAMSSWPRAAQITSEEEGRAEVSCEKPLDGEVRDHDVTSICLEGGEEEEEEEEGEEGEGDGVELVRRVSGDEDRGRSNRRRRSSVLFSYLSRRGSFSHSLSRCHGGSHGWWKMKRGGEERGRRKGRERETREEGGGGGV